MHFSQTIHWSVPDSLNLSVCDFQCEREQDRVFGGVCFFVCLLFGFFFGGEWREGSDLFVPLIVCFILKCECVCVCMCVHVSVCLSVCVHNCMRVCAYAWA